MKSTWKPDNRDVPQWLMLEITLEKILINKLFDGKFNKFAYNRCPMHREVEGQGAGLLETWIVGNIMVSEQLD